MKSLLLSVDLWDLVVDDFGQIAVASEPYSIAQAVASACRLFQGEYIYNTTLGVPYFQEILGHAPPINLVKAELVKAAKTVPGCNNPQVFLSGLTNSRVLSGQVQFTDSSGQSQVVNF